MKSRLIVNPVSGTDAGPDYLPMINQRLRERVGEMDVVMTIGPGDAARAAEQAAEQNYTHLFVAGGDGTLNEAVNGVARVAGAFERITFGLIPLGTGNDFAVALGLPEDIEETLGIINRGEHFGVDLCSANDRYFVNVSAGGFIAEVSDAVHPGLKSVAGKLAYLIGGAQVLLDYESVAARFSGVDEAGRTFERTAQMQMFAVCNSRMVGGGRLIAPHAVVNDGLFDCCLVDAMPMLEFVGLLTRVSSGDHLEDERVSYFRARELNVVFDRAIKVNTDGEVIEARECRYRLYPQAARFLVGHAPFADHT